MSESAARIVIIDQEPLFRHGLKQVIAQKPNCHVVAEAETADGLLPFCKKHKPNTVFLELNLESHGGLSLISELRQNFPKMSLLCHANQVDGPTYAVRVMKVGAQGYLCKRQPPEDYVSALDAALKGQRYISAEVASHLADALYDPDARQGHEGLSDREFQTMLMLASGLSVTDIAERENLSVKTVSEYRARVLRKLGLKHTIELIQYAFRKRLVS